MAYEFEFGNGIDEDVEIVFNIGNGSSNPRFKYNSASGSIEIAVDGSTYTPIGGSIISWENPFRLGSYRMWPDETNQVIREKWGSDPEDEQDGTENLGGGSDFLRV